MSQSLPPLNLQTKVGYGIGEISKEVPSSILVFFLLFFLTNVAGLPPDLAGTSLLIGKSWDAVNDPLIGWLSDRTQSKLGRRFPWILGGAVPLGVSFWLLWQSPPFSQTWQLFGYYTGVIILLFTALTAIAIPHATLGAELTQTYNQRTQLMSFKASFSIGSSILGLIIAQLIFSLSIDKAQQYQLLGASIGIIIIIAAICCVQMTLRRYQQMQTNRPPRAASPQPHIWRQIQTALSLKPFQVVLGIFICSWMGLQITAGIMQYYVVDYLKLDNQDFTAMILAVQGTALIMMLFWSHLAQRFGKKIVYCLGLPLTIIALLGLALLPPNQSALIYPLGILAGLGLSTAYLIPWSMLPDVMDLDELQTGDRREGIFCGVMLQLQKFGTAFSIFLVGKCLESSGYISGEAISQPDSALTAIRWLLGPIPAIILLIGIAIASRYSITREHHQHIRIQLAQKQAAS